MCPQNEVLKETRDIIPEVQNRLQQARSELQDMIDAEPDLKDSEEVQDAQKIMKECFIADESN